MKTAKTENVVVRLSLTGYFGGIHYLGSLITKFQRSLQDLETINVVSTKWGMGFTSYNDT